MRRVLLVSDDFNRADNASLGANWTTGWNAVAPKILTNTAANSAAGDASAFWSANAFTPNQWVMATVAAIDAGVDSYSGVAVRASAGDAVKAQIMKATGQFGIFWYNGGVDTQIGSLYTATPQVGDVIILEAIGSLYRMYVNGVLRISGTNTSAPATGSPGLVPSGTNNGANAVDNWQAGNYVLTKLPGVNIRPASFKPGIAR